MTAELKPCPCGKVPKWLIHVIWTDGHRALKPECCGRWLIEWPEGMTDRQAWNAAPRSAPSEGWQTVPLEWTPEMRDAYNTVCKSAKDLHHAWFVKEAWLAALAVAPRPTAPAGWQSVPTKLTEEMERAAEQSWATGSEPNWRAWLRMIYDVLLAAAPRPTAPAGIKKAAEQMDWQQVVLNGGPPCFHLQDDGRFCGRAERWYGHLGDDPYHGFMSLVDLLSAAPSIPAPDEEQNTQRYSPCLEGTPELARPAMRPDPEGEWEPHRAENEELARQALGFAYAYCATWESEGKRVGELEFPLLAEAWEKANA